MASINLWTEGIILSLAFVAILTLTTIGLNDLYSGNNNVPFVDNSGSETLFIEYQGSAQQQIQGGQVDFNAQSGITLKSTFGMAIDAMKIVWGFVSGGWIEQVIGAWGLGEVGMILAKALRILYFLSVVFAMLYALFKIVL